jgi:hypothetical protein
VRVIKRSEHGLGHLLNPFNPDSDNRDWITFAWELIIDQPDVLTEGGGPAWLDLPALTRIALTSKDVARAFEKYNSGRAWHQQVKPFNFLLHAHIAPFGYPVEADPTRFRLIAPYENQPDCWLHLPWLNLHTGERWPVTIGDPVPPDHARLKTYRETLALYARHPEPKSLDPNGNPCTRRSPPGLLHRRPVTMLTLSLIGKESNRLDETTAGLISTLDETLTTYTDPGLTTWNTLILPALDDFPTRQIAHRTGLDTRTIQRIKKRAITKSHDRNRAVLTLITAQLVTDKLIAWGTPVPATPIEKIAAYIDNRDDHRPEHHCLECGAELATSRHRYCSATCKKRAYRRRRTLSSELAT